VVFQTKEAKEKAEKEHPERLLLVLYMMMMRVSE
jgi:hypothetical protein